jgi:hypothetical protein
VRTHVALFAEKRDLERDNLERLSICRNGKPLMRSMGRAAFCDVPVNSC